MNSFLNKPIGPAALPPKDRFSDLKTQLGGYVSRFPLGVCYLLRRMEVLHLVCVGNYAPRGSQI